jgi:hypothetical protein
LMWPRRCTAALSWCTAKPCSPPWFFSGVCCDVAACAHLITRLVLLALPNKPRTQLTHIKCSTAATAAAVAAVALLFASSFQDAKCMMPQVDMARALTLWASQCTGLCRTKMQLTHITGCFTAAGRHSHDASG